jgi:hypothetical protein
VKSKTALRHAPCIARLTCRHGACRSGFGTWALALAAQLSVCAVGQTKSPYARTDDCRDRTYQRTVLLQATERRGWRQDDGGLRR